MSGKSSKYRNRDVTTITISNDTRKEFKQLQEKYHLEVNDALRLLLYICHQIENEYDICVTDADNPSPPTLV